MQIDRFNTEQRKLRSDQFAGRILVILGVLFASCGIIGTTYQTIYKQFDWHGLLLIALGAGYFYLGGRVRLSVARRLESLMQEPITQSKLGSKL